MMDLLFENPGLFHISEKILKNVDIQTQLNCRLVRKSWNNKFEKLAAKIDLKKLLKKTFTRKEDISSWSKFLDSPKIKVPTLVMNSYLQNIFRKTEINLRKPLFAFVTVGNSKMVELTLKMKPIPIWSEWIYEHGVAFEIAAKNGRINVVKFMKDFFSTAIPLGIHKSAILLATKSGHLEIVKFLADDVTNHDLVVDVDTIKAAVSCGKIEMLQYYKHLLDDDLFETLTLDKTILNSNETAFHYFAWKGDVEKMIRLCRNRNPIHKDIYGQTPIHCAAGSGHLEIMKFLATHTENPETENIFGWTPSRIARFLGFFEIEEYLLQLNNF